MGERLLRVDDSENPVGMVEVVKRAVLIASLAVPDGGKPVAWPDQVRADKQAGDKAIEFLDQHRLIAEGE